jgi:hypothetical protein
VALALGASAISAPAAASEWGSWDKVVLIAFYMVAIFGLQLIVSLVVAIRRGFLNGFRSGGRYLLGSIGTMLAVWVLIWIASGVPNKLILVFWIVLFFAPPVGWYLFHRSQTADD